MKFSYKFSNLLGTVYHKGNLLFSPDGNTLISPVGNRITLFRLKDNKAETLPIESRYNFTTLALAPNGCTLIAVNEPGEALLCSLYSKTVIHRYHFKRPIQDVKFSPDGKYFAVAKENNLFLYRAPGPQTEYNPFHLEKVFCFSYEKSLCIDWTSDSRAIAVGYADMTTKIYATQAFENLSIYTLGSHTDAIVGCFFEENSLDLYTVSKNGQVCVWDCSVALDGLVPEKHENEKNSEKTDHSDEEDEIISEEKEKEVKEKETSEKFYYKRVGKYFLKDMLGKDKEGGYVALSSTAYHRKTHLLVTGFSNGSFLLHEMPDCSLIHSLSISNQVISSVAFNSCGDWLALGCLGVGQLVVWEWQSQSFVLKQQSHFNNMKCLSYSPDGMFVATGGEDGKVKVWSTFSSFCVITKDDHSSAITGLAFTQNGKVILSSSLDGTVRAFDMLRYRNFRTFTSPKPTQFSCLAVDPSGDIVCAGSCENFEIFVWGMKTGKLVQILAGHEAPISGISFSPSEAILISASWDKTVHIWNVFENKGSRETITLIADGLSVVFRPDGFEFAVSTLDGQISFFNVHTAEQLGTIEGRNDLYVGRRESDSVTAEKLLKAQAFTTLCYTANGDCLLAAGKSKYICIYHIAEKILLKKFEVTCNLSFDAVEDFINRRRMTEFGNKALIEERSDEAMEVITLPGTKKLDLSSRAHRPQISVASVQFSPTGRAWAAATTEGLLIYSLDSTAFDPFNLDIEVTPKSIRKALKDEDYSQAIMMAFRLNETKIIIEVLESIPINNVPTIAAYLPQLYVEKLLSFAGAQLEMTQHLEFYLLWIQNLLMCHGMQLKERSGTITDTICTLQRNLKHHLDDLGKICENNKYSIDFLLSLGEVKKHKRENAEENEILINQDDEMLMETKSDTSESGISESDTSESSSMES